MSKKGNYHPQRRKSAKLAQKMTELSLEQKREQAVNIVDLPVDVLCIILNKLDKTKDIRSAMNTCGYFRNILKNENSIWKRLEYQRLNMFCFTDSNQSWYSRCRISSNWCNGVFRELVAVHNTTMYMPWIRLYGAESMLLSVGSELKCFGVDQRGMPRDKHNRWTITVPTVHRLDIRTNDISRFVLKKDHVVCGNRDGCFSIFEFDDLTTPPQCVNFTRDCHDGGLAEVTCVESARTGDHYSVMTSYVYGRNVLFWTPNGVRRSSKRKRFANAFDMEVSRSVKANNCDGVRCLAINEDDTLLAMGPTGNTSPMLLDIETGNWLINPIGEKNERRIVKDVQWHDERSFLTVTHGGRLALTDVRTGRTSYEMNDPLDASLYCVRSGGGSAVVVGSAEYCRCVLFDVRRTDAHVQMYFTQRRSSPVYSLDFDSSRLVAAADCTVAALSFNVSQRAMQRDFSSTFVFIKK